MTYQERMKIQGGIRCNLKSGNKREEKYIARSLSSSKSYCLLQRPLAITVLLFQVFLFFIIIQCVTSHQCGVNSGRKSQTACSGPWSWASFYKPFQPCKEQWQCLLLPYHSELSMFWCLLFPDGCTDPLALSHYICQSLTPMPTEN